VSRTALTTSGEQQLAQYVLRKYDCPADELPARLERYKDLIRVFSANFNGESPHYIVRAPGRVNLIGEHTDYNGYPVLPMAIDRDFVLAMSSSSDLTIEIINRDPAYEPRAFQARLPIEPYDQGDWGNYVKAAVNGLLEGGFLEQRTAAGFHAVIDGNIPESAGLSSSSALVVASALAFLAANDVHVDPHTLADLLARAERYAGSEGGGMDQAISLLAEPNKALKIDFFPLRTQSVQLPDALTFVVCNSLIRAPKSEGARSSYNRRVVECRLAAAILSRALSAKIGRRIQTTLLADLSAEKLKMEERELDDLARQAIGEKPLLLAEISHYLGEPIDAVRTNYCTLKSGGILTEPQDGFDVWKRYRHVVTEARRVENAAAALQQGNTKYLGSLMDDSHSSCRDDYEISCLELEMLVSIAREHGALGARLTGAGFGGCTVNAVLNDQVEDFIYGVANEYYEDFIKAVRDRTVIEVKSLRDIIFPCRASGGAGILSLQ